MTADNKKPGLESTESLPFIGIKNNFFTVKSLILAQDER